MTVNLVVVKAIDEHRCGRRPKEDVVDDAEEIAAAFRFPRQTRQAAITGPRIPLYGR